MRNIGANCNTGQPSMKIDWRSAMNIISYTTLDNFSEFKKKQENYSGTELFSLILPSRINITPKNIEIINGEITKGYLSNDSLGPKKGNSIIHAIWEEYGHKQTQKFIDDTQRLINNFNLWNGFSVGLGDIIIPTEVYTELNKLIEGKKLEVNYLITEMEKYPDLIDPETFEQIITSDLNSVRSNVSKLVLANVKPNNNIKIQITSGAKGNEDNMGQMAGAICQQSVEGKRIQKKLNGRSLAYFPQNDDSAIARGFVERPFIKGIDPIGFIFHNMASREGLIDTAIKTSESGYLQRKLVKSEEDAIVKYDCTVRIETAWA